MEYLRGKTDYPLPEEYREGFKDAPDWVLNPDLPKGDDWDPLKKPGFREKIRSWPSLQGTFLKSSWNLKEYMVGGVIFGTGAAFYALTGLEALSFAAESLFHNPPIASGAIKGLTEGSFLYGFSSGVLVVGWLNDPERQPIHAAVKNKLKRFI